MLSEQPSNKPHAHDGVSYGDGRGFSSEFGWGETEDYIYNKVSQDDPPYVQAAESNNQSGAQEIENTALFLPMIQH